MGDLYAHSRLLRIPRRRIVCPNGLYKVDADNIGKNSVIAMAQMDRWVMNSLVIRTLLWMSLVDGRIGASRICHGVEWMIIWSY